MGLEKGKLNKVTGETVPECRDHTGHKEQCRCGRRLLHPGFQHEANDLASDFGRREPDIESRKHRAAIPWPLTGPQRPGHISSQVGEHTHHQPIVWRQGVKHGSDTTAYSIRSARDVNNLDTAAKADFQTVDPFDKCMSPKEPNLKTNFP